MYQRSERAEWFYKMSFSTNSREYEIWRTGSPYNRASIIEHQPGCYC